MSMDRNVWIYGTGLLVIVGGCFAIGYTLLPSKPTFNAKQTAAVVTPEVTPPPPVVAEVDSTVPKLVIEDITAEKDASTKQVDEPTVDDTATPANTPDELDITVDSSKSSDIAASQPGGVSDDNQTKQPSTEVIKVLPPKPSTKPQQEPATPKKGMSATDQPPPLDDSIPLFRVRIDAVKPTRKDAASLVSELKDKGFSATVLPLAGGFVVQTGAFRDRRSAETLQRSLLDNGYDASISN